jgi:hypothetical protein
MRPQVLTTPVIISIMENSTHHCIDSRRHSECPTLRYNYLGSYDVTLHDREQPKCRFSRFAFDLEIAAIY